MELSEDEITYVFNLDKLYPGDILLINDYEERLIEKAGSKYIHAAVYMGDAQIIASDGLGVGMNHIFSFGFKEKDDAKAFRVKGVTEQQINDVIREMLRQMGKEWSGLEAARVPLLKESDNQSESKKTYCSRLVAEAYESVGKSIVKNASYCAPFDFINSVELDEISDVLTEADDTAKKCVLCHQPARVNGEGTSIIAEWLSKCSEVWQTELQCLTDLLSVSVYSNDFEKDETCIKIIKESGFFDFPNKLKTDWPWLWDDDGFFNQKETVEDQLWFIYNQILHFTRTYIPYSSETFANLKILSHRYPDNLLIKEFLTTYDNAIKTNVHTLERLVTLLYEVIERTPREWNAFSTKYSDIREYLKDFLSDK